LGGVCINFRQFFGNYKVAQNLATFFPKKKFCISLNLKWVRPHFRRFFHKLIWSPCSGQEIRW
jgi:hypothetical protein